MQLQRSQLAIVQMIWLHLLALLVFHLSKAPWVYTFFSCTLPVFLITLEEAKKKAFAVMMEEKPQLFTDNETGEGEIDDRKSLKSSSELGMLRLFEE